MKCCNPSCDNEAVFHIRENVGFCTWHGMKLILTTIQQAVEEAEKEEASQ